VLAYALAYIVTAESYVDKKFITFALVGKFSAACLNVYEMSGTKWTPFKTNFCQNFIKIIFKT